MVAEGFILSLPSINKKRAGNDAQSEPGLVEIGWLVFDNLDEVDRKAIEVCRERVTKYLQQLLPEFHWRIAVETREAPSETIQREPAESLQWARGQRDVRGWDYAVIFVKPDLTARHRPHAWACFSRSLDSAVISTARIDPRADNPDSSPEERVQLLASRLQKLTLRSVGHLCGLQRVDTAGNIMGDWNDLGGLDRAKELTDRQLRQMEETLKNIADVRLEEERPSATTAWWSFYARAAWRNRMEIVDGLRQARPWQMPFRLARLTIAALTSMLVLTMTAEAWELGIRLRLDRVLGLSLVATLVTIAYVLNRQGLLLRRRHVGLSEQIVTTNVTTVAIVTTGILTTYACLFVLTLLFGLALFDVKLVASWAASVEEPITWRHYWSFAGFVSSTGIVIGALGASFEGQSYFRHITYVDEEV